MITLAADGSTDFYGSGSRDLRRFDRTRRDEARQLAHSIDLIDIDDEITDVMISLEEALGE